MAIELTLDHLLTAARPGGASALSAVTHLAPAAGPHALVAPSRYQSREGATYLIETRFIAGRFQQTALLDSRTSVANRIEEALNLAIDDGHPILSRMPRIVVRYEAPDRTTVVRDTEAPHRAFDAHFRAGTVDGTPVVQVQDYRAARDSHPGSAGALLDLSPLTVLLGGWDATRKSNQARFPAAITGEIVGVISVDGITAVPTHRSGARIDPVAAKIELPTGEAQKIAELQRDELSAKKLDQVRKAKTATYPASSLGLGAIPPQADGALDGIATTDIIRSYVLAFATLRRLRFGRGPEGDAALRALLAAIALDGMVRNDAELAIRANCHLIEAGPTTMLLDGRQGTTIEITPPTIDEADALLAAAYDHATRVAGLDWHGQSLEIVGNPAVVAGAIDVDEA